MLRHSPLSAAATAGSNSSGSKTRNVMGSPVKPVQHHLDRASLHFEGFIVDLMDRITNVRNDIFIFIHHTGSNRNVKTNFTKKKEKYLN